MELTILALVLIIVILACTGPTNYGGGSCTIKPEPTEEQKRKYAEWVKNNPPVGQGGYQPRKTLGSRLPKGGSGVPKK